ncbi:MAG: hypothetical protein IJ877_00625 [Candidatus Gastranaerophilales bacterium]|nr:hypothetical protein [Candidatus Gastranaerophilales bacterium]
MITKISTTEGAFRKKILFEQKSKNNSNSNIAQKKQYNSLPQNFNYALYKINFTSDYSYKFVDDREEKEYDPYLQNLVDLIKQGRLQEAIEQDNRGRIQEALSALNINANGEIDYSVKLPEKQSPDALEELKQKEAALDEKYFDALDRADEVADRKLPAFYKSGRKVKSIMTAGISEALRNSKLEENRKAYKRGLENARTQERKKIIDYAYNRVTARNRQISACQSDIDKLNTLEHKKEEVRKKLQEEVIQDIITSYADNDYEVTNYVMLKGENPFIAQEFAQWSANIAHCNFSVVPSRVSLTDMQKGLTSALNQAEELWQKEGKRSIIFVEGMEKLLSQDNSQSDIALMKDIMQKTDMNYHTTLFFHTSDPDKLDKTTLSANRTGVIINTGISLNDTNLRYSK